MTYNRLEIIKQLLLEKNIVSFKELESQFPEVSTMTLRRDIERLEHEGFAMKIRGGAKKVDQSKEREDLYSKRANRNIEEKQLLASNALQFIEIGRSVFLDSGSTIMELAKILPDVHLSIITSGPNIALEITKNHNPSVSILGGTINSYNCSVAGPTALASIKNFNIDIAFITPSGYSSNGGFTVGNYAECEVKRAIIKKANMVIMLMEQEKINKSLPFTFATLKDIDVIITNGELSKEFTKLALKARVNIIKV